MDAIGDESISRDLVFLEEEITSGIVLSVALSSKVKVASDVNDKCHDLLAHSSYPNSAKF